MNFDVDHICTEVKRHWRKVVASFARSWRCGATHRRVILNIDVNTAKYSSCMDIDMAPRAAKPTKSIFDPFNSSATGHQRAENSLSGSTSWRDSRSLKLREQFIAGAGGGKRVSDTVGAGSLDFGVDGRTESGSWVRGAKGLRTGGQQSIWESSGVVVDKDVERPAKRLEVEAEEKPTCLVNPFTPFRKANGSIRESSWTSHESSPSRFLLPLDPPSSAQPESSLISSEREENLQEERFTPKPVPCPQIFKNLCIYINGSTAPQISDHKLKHMLSNHGARLSISLGRRSVTHVVIGRPNSKGGSGGGLAASKIQKEIRRTAGEVVRYVTAEWVVESVKAGKRLPESRFEALTLAPKGVNSVASIFKTVDRPARGDG